MVKNILEVKENINYPGINISSGNFNLSITFVKPNINRNIFIGKNEYYLFENIWDGVNIEYKKSRSSLKEKITILDIDSVHVLRFNINSNYKVVKNNEVIKIMNKNGEEMFKFSNLNVFNKNLKSMKDIVKISFDANKNILEIRINRIGQYQYPIIIE